jgi:hypothetical protein
LLKRVAVAAFASRAEKESEALHGVEGLFMRGYLVEMLEQSQTIGSALTDTPIGMAGWFLDHDPDSYEKISRAFLEGKSSGGLTRERIVDNMTLYWVTNTANSAARLYWETGQAVNAAIASGAKWPPDQGTAAPDASENIRHARPSRPPALVSARTSRRCYASACSRTPSARPRRRKTHAKVVIASATLLIPHLSRTTSKIEG